MRFLLKMTFWLGVIAVLLPRDESASKASAQLNARDAVSAASATVGDMRQFCDRQPEACIVGSQAAAALEDRAKAGAKRLYEMLNQKLASNDSDGVTTAATPTRNGKPMPLPPPRPIQHAAQNPASTVSPAQNASQNTLTPADLAPSWHGPVPHKDPRERPA
ncbi:MAG TPA: DUF5330 domain-containing protein [Xanthobacteraceae bacterium]